MDQLEEPLQTLRETGAGYSVCLPRALLREHHTNSGMVIGHMAPWHERTMTTQEGLVRSWPNGGRARRARVRFHALGLSSGGGDSPVQFVLGGPNYETLAEWRDIVIERAEELSRAGAHRQRLQGNPAPGRRADRQESSCGARGVR